MDNNTNPDRLIRPRDAQPGMVIQYENTAGRIMAGVIDEVVLLEGSAVNIWFTDACGITFFHNSDRILPLR